MSPLADYLALIKFRLLTLVLVSTCMGFFIGADATTPLAPLFYTLLGITLVGGGANTLNQWKERSNDALMYRTRARPLPAKRLAPKNALVFGIVISVLGFAVMGFGVNALTLMLGFLSWSSYLFVYTPLKTRSPLNTWVGAVPGAIPAILGCTAATGTLNDAAVALFLILFVWQMPHFFAISWVYRDDYLRGGFRMLSWNDESGKRTAFHILLHTIILVPVSAGLYLVGHSGLIYLVFTLASSLVFLVYALGFYHDISGKAAKRVFNYSIIYLPLLFIAIIADKLL
ncbi:MAG: Protoheme farnesyltransferase 2 [Pseudomonadota bacterium]|jgi:protoheme IX farnesyltransferase